MLASRVEVDEEARTPHAADLEAADSLRNAEPVIQDVSRPELEGVLTGIVLRETTTLGVRSHDVRRVELERHYRTVETR